MLKIVRTKKDLTRFIYYIEKLYKDDPYVVYPIFSSLKKELREEVLNSRKYTALLCYNGKEIVGRIMYTIDFSKKQGKNICYYSFFDCINDINIARELFDYMETDMKSKGINYIEGTFAPYDPDTRRGVLVKGFDSSPVVFTSYNYDYYGNLLEELGCVKAIDTVLLNADVNEKTKKRLNTFSKFFERNHDVRIDSLNFKNLDKDIKDVHSVLQTADTDIVYQEAPSIELIADVAKNLKFFINPNLIRIARENETNKPVGFCLVLPDYNQVFKKTKGRIRIFKILFEKRKITKARGMMQYIVPEYQNTGLIGHMFNVIFNEFNVMGITQFEAGTMMEDNPKPINAFKKFGGDIIKIYRLYGKEL
jgi:hypothetical protein